MEAVHSIGTMGIHRMYAVNSLHMARLTARLSSGLRINHAGDDAAGLAMSEKMRAEIRGLHAASRNTEDAVSLIQTAEGAMGVLHALLARIRELAVQSSCDIHGDAVDRVALNAEASTLIREIGDIASRTEFNGIKLLDGSLAETGGATGGLCLLVGSQPQSVYRLHIDGMSTQTLGISSLDILTGDSAENAIGQADTAIRHVSLSRAKLGAVYNRFIHTIDFLNSSAENLQEAESRIRDIDFARAMTEHASVSALMQAGEAMIVQAGASALDVLSLLR